MNFIEFETAQKLRGGFYTDPVIASFLTKWIINGRPESILEPSCGDGAFLEQIQQQMIPSLKRVTACEIEPVEAEKARKRTSLPLRVLNVDFLRWFLFDAQYNEQFDAVIGNPPFIRYQYLPEEQQLLAEKIFAQLDLPFTKHTNAWVPFILASTKLLKPGGRIAMVVPSEILHIPHAASLRRYLASQCSKVLLIDPQEIWFGETLQGTVLLLAEKKSSSAEKSQGVGIISIKSRADLSKDPEYQFLHALYANGESTKGKWMQILLTSQERELLQQIRNMPSIKRFEEVASVDVGIVTGANKFFLVPDNVVEKYNLQHWSHPMFGRSEHVKGIIFSKKDYEENCLAGMPTNFLWFNDVKQSDLPQNVQKYLEIGINQKLHARFKCRTRKCWYIVPSVYASPIAMLKRAHHIPRLVLNKAEAYTTDTAYRIQPIGISTHALVYSFINSLTCLTAELEGRHYGGGVLELVPSEIERLLLPIIDVSDSELDIADHRFRNQNDIILFLQEQDSIVLGKIGLSKSDQNVLHGAWLKLRDRRHRTPIVTN